MNNIEIILQDNGYNINDERVGKVCSDIVDMIIKKCKTQDTTFGKDSDTGIWYPDCESRIEHLLKRILYER